ncbi:MAG: replication protein [Circoviridae sp.]|nr:MAG: replication protein [Circoviridae sp.]
MNAVCGYDFTISCKICDDKDKVIRYLNKVAKKWTFQQEKGANGYLHFQGRLSLKVKKRLTEIKTEFPIHFSITSSYNAGNDFYVTKDDTRVEGPWSNTDEVIYIPRQIREIEELRPWQKTVINSLSVWDTRSVNMIYCSEGNIGKSILVGWCRAHKVARALPPVNDHKDIMRMVCDLPTSRSYLIDMPRSMNKDRLYGFYSGVETIKDGYAYDDRYSFTEKVFDCPNIWIFSNTLPDETMLSNDRWKIWCVENMELVKYVEPKDDLDIVSGGEF